MALCVLIIVWVLPKGRKFKYEFEKGKPWMHENLVAPFDFALEKTSIQVKEEREEIALNTPPYYRRSDESLKPLFKNVVNDFNVLWTQKYPVTTVGKQPFRETNRQFAEGLITAIYKKGVIAVDQDHQPYNASKNIMIVQGVDVSSGYMGNFYTISTALKFISEELNQHSARLDTALIFSALQSNLIENINYDESITQKVIDEEIRKLPLNKGMVRRGETIIEESSIVNEDRYRILLSLKSEYDKRLGILGNKYIVTLGQIVLVSLILTLLMVFLSMFRKDIYADLRKMFIILLIVTSMLVFLSWALRMKFPSLYFIPYCIVPIIIRVIFDTRLALYIHLLVVIVAGFFVPNGYEFIFLQITAGMVAINSIKNLLRRGQFLYSALLIYITYVVGFIGISIVHEGSFVNIDWHNLLWFLVSVVLSLIAYPLIYAFEKLFGITTEVTLMEYSNTNHPLLRDLSYKAPGTFQHSLQVANLAEAAIFEIGGNALMIRVGALYHDIGKMESPQYFIENQQHGVNPHDNLPYEESAKIIIRHVYAGIELASKYRLPSEIVDFIRTHHGNTRVDYFYQSFLKNYPERSVNENVFRYPGPIPFSKETAVLMLADSVEAASRSLKTPTELSINELVERVIDYKINQQQLINSDISIKEIYRIKQIFKEMLISIYHVRIDYLSE